MSSTSSVADYSKCYSCSKQTRFYVSNHHRKYSHCAFLHRPYCNECWSPQINNYKTYALGDHWIYHVQVNGEMLDINQQLHEQYVESAK